MPNPITPTSNCKTLSTLQALLDTPFSGQTNALCYARSLQGNYHELVQKLSLHEDITTISPADLLALTLSPQGDLARQTILNDLQTLQNHGAQPTLNLLKRYERDDTIAEIPTDVYSYHVDRSPVPTDTFLCTYYGATSQLLPNLQAQQKITIPHIRSLLRELYDGPEAGFDAFLTEHFFDLHYQALPHAQAITQQTGHIWKLAVDHPQQQVLPCVHRAPTEDGLRLLLIC